MCIKKTDFRILAVPNHGATVTTSKIYSIEEMKNIKQGFCPKSMDDRWFIYFENNQLYFHRSWSSQCYYVASFCFKNDNFEMHTVRCPNAVDPASMDSAIESIIELIDIFLLKKSS